jgi:hypothetical protein
MAPPHNPTLQHQFKAVPRAPRRRSKLQPYSFSTTGTEKCQGTTFSRAENKPRRRRFLAAAGRSWGPRHASARWGPPPKNCQAPRPSQNGTPLITSHLSNHFPPHTWRINSPNLVPNNLHAPFRIINLLILQAHRWARCARLAPNVYRACTPRAWRWCIADLNFDGFIFRSANRPSGAARAGRRCRHGVESNWYGPPLLALRGYKK